MAYFSGLKPRLIAIPTTSGSGSEVTDFAILTHGGTKHPLVDDTLRPNVAILDGDLLTELPKSLIAAGGFDLISHAMEAVAAKNAGSISNALASDAFCTAWKLLGASYRGDVSARLPLHNAATMAGMAFSAAGLGLCHAISHSLGGEFHIPHGRLNAILLPAVVEHNRAAREKYAALARRAGLSGVSETVAVRNLKNALCHLRQELQMPESLSAAGISPTFVWEKRSKIIDAVLKDPCCATNPQVVTADAVAKILEEVTGRG
jgi:alcohol dehydrogenase class IV